MELIIIAVYTIIEGLLISLGHQTHPQAKMSDAEVMTTAIIAALFYGGNHQNACRMLKNNGYIPTMLGHSRYNRRLHNVSRLFETLLTTLAQISKSNNPMVFTRLIPSPLLCATTFGSVGVAVF